MLRHPPSSAGLATSVLSVVEPEVQASGSLDTRISDITVGRGGRPRK